MRVLLIMGCLIALLLSCGKEDAKLCPPHPLSEESTVDAETIEILKEVINDFYPNHNWMHVLQNTYVVSNTSFDLLPFTLEQSMTDDFVERNQAQQIIWPELNNRSHLITFEEIDCLLKTGSVGNEWDLYYQIYPQSKGIITFTRPGFNSSGNLAVLEYSYTCNLLCGAGYIVILQKINGSWEALNQYPTWVS